MLSDDDLIHIYDIGFRDDEPTRESELAGLRAVAEAAAKQATDNAAFVVEEAMSKVVNETPEWWMLHDLAKTIRAASISTDKAGVGE